MTHAHHWWLYAILHFIAYFYFFTLTSFAQDQTNTSFGFNTLYIDDNSIPSDQGDIAEGFSFRSNELESRPNDNSSEHLQGICHVRPIDLSQWIYLQQAVMISLQFNYSIPVDQSVHVCLMRKTDNRFEILNPPINVSNMVSTSYQDISICEPKQWDGDELFLGFIQQGQSINRDSVFKIHQFHLFLNDFICQSVVQDLHIASKNSISLHLSWLMDNTMIQAYEIQRSRDNQDWQTIYVSDVVLQETNFEYEFHDLKPIKGFNFYRIKTNHRNGQIQYSTIVEKEMISKESSIVAYPNPTMDWITIHQMNEPTQSITLYDSQGNTISVKERLKHQSEQTHIMAMGDLPAGLYFLTVDQSIISILKQ